MKESQSGKPYLVILRSTPGIILPDGIRKFDLRFPQERALFVSLVQIDENINGQSLPSALEYRVRILEESLEKAVFKSTQIVDGIASLITFTTGVSMPTPKVMVCYDVSEDAKEHDFMQFFDDFAFNNPSRKRIAEDKFRSIVDRFNSISDKVLFERVSRAIRWFRAGAASTDNFERFNCFWIGLESLNPLLQSKLGIGNDKTTCPECKHEWELMPTVSGIREFFSQKVDQGKPLYKTIRDLRIDIMHSKKRLFMLAQKVSSVVIQEGNTLLGAIQFLLGFPEPWISHEEFLTSAIPFRLELDGKLIADKLEDVFPDPHFESDHGVINIGKSNEGNPEIEVKSNFTPVIGSGSILRVEGIGLAGEGRKVKLNSHMVSKK